MGEDDSAGKSAAVSELIDQLGVAVGARDDGSIATCLKEVPLLVATSPVSVRTSVCVCRCCFLTWGDYGLGGGMTGRGCVGQGCRPLTLPCCNGYACYVSVGAWYVHSLSNVWTLSFWYVIFRRVHSPWTRIVLCVQ